MAHPALLPFHDGQTLATEHDEPFLGSFGVVVAEALPGLQDVDVETDVWLIRLLGPVEIAPHTEAGDRFPGHL